MKITAWRVVRKHHLSSALSGEGARLYPGRWNERGVPMIYAAASPSLAALEVLVHLEASDLLNLYKLIPIIFDKRCCRPLPEAHLPADWAAEPPPMSTRAIGTEWCKSQTSLVLAVPSVIVPLETNYLINPKHPDFVKIRVGEARGFSFDPRILKTAGLSVSG